MINSRSNARISVQDERIRLTWQGIADVDVGLVIDHQTVQAWVDSLEAEQPLPAPTALRSA
jgi:predicted transcriptional regulator